MEMKPVVSSQIATIGHDPETKRMQIRFASKGDIPGSLYEYANVDQETFDALAGAESIGSHFYKHLKPFPDCFPFRQIVSVPEAIKKLGTFSDVEKMAAYMEKLDEDVKQNPDVAKCFKSRLDELKKAHA